MVGYVRREQKRENIYKELKMGALCDFGIILGFVSVIFLLFVK